MEIDWGPVIGGLGGAFLTGILLVLGGMLAGSFAWRQTKNWDRQRGRELAFKRWARLLQGAIESFCHALDRYESCRKRPVLTELCFNFLHIHSSGDRASQEGYEGEIARVDGARVDDLKALQRRADAVFHDIKLRKYWRTVSLDSIKPSEREYVLAEDDAVLRSVAERIARGTTGNRRDWAEFGEWLRKEVLKTKK